MRLNPMSIDSIVALRIIAMDSAMILAYWVSVCGMDSLAHWIPDALFAILMIALLATLFFLIMMVMAFKTQMSLVFRM